MVDTTNIASVIATGDTTNVARLILGTYQRYASLVDGAAGDGLEIEIIEEAYPETDTENGINADMTPRHSLSLAIAAGFRAGAMGKPDLACDCEAAIRTLEGLHGEGLVYGMVAGDDEDPTRMRFIIKVPGEPAAHLRTNFKFDGSLADPNVELP